MDTETNAFLAIAIVIIFVGAVMLIDYRRIKRNRAEYLLWEEERKNEGGPK